MESPSHAITATVRRNLLRVFHDTGLNEVLDDDLIEAGLEDLELGLGQVLADVEKANRRGVRLSTAVHTHEQFPYLARVHGLLADSLVGEVPDELLPWVRKAVRLPPPADATELRNALCVVARSNSAQVAERALARFALFEGIRVNLFVAAWRTEGSFEGLGGCARDLDDIADEQLEALLRIPLAEDADEPYRPFETVVVAALERLVEFTDVLFAAQAEIDELRNACANAARLERLLRQTDPRDAAVLRNKFSRAVHRQRIPAARLPLEHPLLLGGYHEDAIHQRTSRATKMLAETASKAIKAPSRVLLADVLVEMMEANDA